MLSTLLLLAQLNFALPPLFPITAFCWSPTTMVELAEMVEDKNPQGHNEYFETAVRNGDCVLSQVPIAAVDLKPVTEKIYTDDTAGIGAAIVEAKMPNGTKVYFLIFKQVGKASPA